MSLSNTDSVNLQKFLHCIPEGQYKEWVEHAEGVLTLVSFAKIHGIALDSPGALEELAAALIAYVDGQDNRDGWWLQERKRMQSDAFAYAY